MDSANRSLHPPHFTVSGRDVGPSESQREEPGSAPDLLSTGAPRDIGALMLRGADCLAAALSDCTSEAGLNESRYRVLVALERRTSGECSQSDLADLLLQSESNLSTLLERMSGDGLITRARSQTDRRRSLIRITPLGLAALSRADRTRAATVVRLMREFSLEEAVQLADGLQHLVGDLERSLEAGARRASGLDRALPARHLARPPDASCVPAERILRDT